MARGGQDHCSLYLVMELCEGGELFDRLVEETRHSLRIQSGHSLGLRPAQKAVRPPRHPSQQTFETDVVGAQGNDIALLESSPNRGSNARGVRRHDVKRIQSNQHLVLVEECLGICLYSVFCPLHANWLRRNTSPNPL